jgi:shikimate dehydrogenase
VKKDKPNSPSKSPKVNWTSPGNPLSEKKGSQDKSFKLYGIFGYPLSHTLSPAMHEAAFCELGIDANYIVLELIPVAFKKLMRQSSRLSLSGFNVTVPYKEIVMEYLDKVLPEARAIGAVNTVYKQGKQWTGTNTDMEGFLLTLKKDGGFRPSGKSAVIFGAGGAARAVVYGLSREAIRKVLIADCFPEKARKIAKDMQKVFPRVTYQAATAGTSEVKEALQKADVIINATPLGLKSGDPRVVPDSWIKKARVRKQFFMDLVYNPALTPFLKTAKKKGHGTLNGLGMLLYQGARALEYWTGRKAPVSVMRQALLGALKEKGK